MIDDSERRLPVIIEEAAIRTQHAQLQSIAALVVGTAAMADLPQICWRQAPILCKLVLTRIGADPDATPQRCIELPVSRRH